MLHKPLSAPLDIKAEADEAEEFSTPKTNNLQFQPHLINYCGFFVIILHLNDSMSQYRSDYP
jgi:hypothetical protein